MSCICFCLILLWTMCVGGKKNKHNLNIPSPPENGNNGKCVENSASDHETLLFILPCMADHYREKMMSQISHQCFVGSCCGRTPHEDSPAGWYWFIYRNVDYFLKWGRILWKVAAAKRWFSYLSKGLETVKVSENHHSQPRNGLAHNPCSVSPNFLFFRGWGWANS